VEQKRRIGNPGHRALPETTSVLPGANPNSPPEPVRHLGQFGLEFWNRAWAAGAAWIAPGTDIELLQITCEQLDERQMLRSVVFRDGNWRDRAALRSLDRQIMDGLSMLGFTPTDRARLGGGEVKHVDELEEYRRRVVARAAGA